MFETVEELARLTRSELAAAVARNHTIQVRAENQALVLAAVWADQHSPDPADARDSDTVPRERVSVYGGEGAPEVGEFCCAELGALIGVGSITARMLIADALDLRHRLPLLWSRVVDGQVRAWKARKVAAATRHLTKAAAGQVDEVVHGLTEMVPWARLERVLLAAIAEADPALARQRSADARARRGVWSWSSEDGVRTIVAKVAAGDAALFMATLNRIAELLAVRAARAGREPESIDRRRSEALRILAQPADALQLLLAHRDEAGLATEPTPTPTSTPDEPEQATPTLPDLSDAGMAALASIARAGRPQVVLHYHLADAALRVGYGLVRPGDHSCAISLDALRSWLAETGCPITVRPVFEPAKVPAVDRYEIPQSIRDAIALRDVADTFPYGSIVQRLDLDHTNPYRENGPPGQTSVDKLGPLSRFHHRVATHGRWQRRQPDSGTYVWRSPNGWVWLVTNQGTLGLGSSDYAQAVWRAARPALVDLQSMLKVRLDVPARARST